MWLHDTQLSGGTLVSYSLGISNFQQRDHLLTAIAVLQSESASQCSMLLTSFHKNDNGTVTATILTKLSKERVSAIFVNLGLATSDCTIHAVLASIECHVNTNTSAAGKAQQNLRVQDGN